MATTSIARLYNRVRRFVAAREGNVAVIFALATLPIIGMTGAAIDYGRASAARTDLQSALDATALMVSKSAPTMTEEDLQGAAEAYFNAIFKSGEAGTTTVIAKYNPATSTVTITGSSSVKSDFMGALGIPNVPIGSTSSVTWGTSRLRVALALDNTGSMASSNKMTALKAAAKNLLTQLQSAALKDGDVYVSIVPFSKDVNVGDGNWDADWVDFRNHKNYTGWDNRNGTCSKSFDRGEEHTRANCEDHNGNWTPASRKDTWNGCVTDRDKDDDYDVTVAAPDVDVKKSLFPAEQYSQCPVSLMPLSDVREKFTDLKTKIDDMQPVGNTNVTIGLVWAWQSLTEGAPLFAPEEDSKYKYQKVIILLTDGQNTENRFTTRQSDIDDRTRLACQNAKAKDIIIYTVRVMDGSKSLLEGCATDKEKYFHLQSADGLVEAFKQIGVELSSLRVSK